MEPIYMTADALATDPPSARKVANEGPVIILEDGRPTHVLMSMKEFERLTGEARPGNDDDG